MTEMNRGQLLVAIVLVLLAALLVGATGPALNADYQTPAEKQNDPTCEDSSIDINPDNDGVEIGENCDDGKIAPSDLDPDYEPEEVTQYESTRNAFRQV